MINYENKTIKAWWSTMPKPGNFGDILTPYIIKKMSGFNTQHINLPAPEEHLLSVGSIISRASEYSTVWGSGAMQLTNIPHCDAKYLAVRGPITRDLILANGGSCPSVYGDPALLLPKLYDKPVDQIYDIGFVPHYVDYEQVHKWYSLKKEVKIINLLNDNIPEVINQFKQCKRLVSSSLHGLIVAAAYGIPVTWIKLSDKLVGDSTKFYDFFQSVNVKHDFLDIRQKPRKIEEWSKLNYIKHIDINLTPLIQSFPIKIA